MNLEHFLAEKNFTLEWYYVVRHEVTDLTADWWFHAHSLVSDTTKLREMKLFRDPRSSSVSAVKHFISEEWGNYKSLILVNFVFQTRT